MGLGNEVHDADHVHVLIVPFPASGHDLALMDLTHQLALRGVIITILVTPKNLHSLNPILSLHPSTTITTLTLPFPSDPSSKIPPGIEHMKDLPLYEFIEPMITTLSKLYDPLLQWFQTHPSPPNAIISDFFLGSWTNRLALHLGIPRLAFSPISAHSMALWWVASYRHEESYISSLQSWGMVFNTFLELDGKHLNTIKKDFLKHDRAWGVGPLPSIRTGLSDKGGPCSIPADDIMAWLDSCHVDGSVVYVAFGSQAVFNRKQMEVVAGALEESGVRFIWVLKEPIMRNNDGLEAHDQNVVPPGFEDRMAGRGLVVRGWAPQVAIIQHRAVGCYFSHCGWNSVLEGLLGGLSLIVWPMQGDNFANGKLLAEELGVAVKVCEESYGIPDQQHLTKTLAESVSGNRPERVRALELKEKALNAMKPGGSSHKALDDMVDALSSFKLGSQKT